MWYFTIAENKSLSFRFWFEFYSLSIQLHIVHLKNITTLSKRDSLTVSALACHAADPGSNPAQGDDFFN